MNIHSVVQPLSASSGDALVVAINATNLANAAKKDKAAKGGTDKSSQPSEQPDSGFGRVLAALDEDSKGYFSARGQAGQLPKKAGEIRTFYDVDGIAAQSVVVVAVDYTRKGLDAAAQSVATYLRSHRLNKAAVTWLQDDLGKKLTALQAARALAQGLLVADYCFDDYKSDTKSRASLKVAVLLSDANADIDAGIAEGIAIANGMNLLRDLGNAPGNVCTPKYLAKTAKQLAKKHDSLTVEVLKEDDIEKLKMGALLSVAKGSIEKPRLIKLQHRGGAQRGDDAPIILVGKGVTFDTGGISLKPGAGMDEMKYDMCGAGSVLGTMQTIAELRLPINVIGIIPTVENMPSDRASKPGDIVTSMSGKTIEILNTDAEGRLILCDALTYARQFKPKAMIDIATLTGAVIVALGRQPSGLMANDDALATALLDAGEASGDRAWRLPVWEEYTKELKSPFADLQNIGSRDGGAITAGCFLSEFAKDVPWAHLDIAGTAWTNRKKGASGRPVPLLVEYLMSQVEP